MTSFQAQIELHKTQNTDSIDLRQLLQEYFGYTSFRPFQEEIIRAVLGGENVLATMPTGGGKSICYQLPALALPGLAIVVSPLIALMEDQVRSLQQNGIEAEFLNSSLNPDKRREIWVKLENLKRTNPNPEIYHGSDPDFDEQNQPLKLLYISPERMFSPDFWELLQDLPVSFFAIDEAHCLSTWGHDFRPEYIQLNRLKPAFPEIPILALTATADELTRTDILKNLNLQPTRQSKQTGPQQIEVKQYNHARINPNQACQVFISSFDRPNIHYRIEPKQDSFKKLIEFLSEHSGEAGIVYCLSRNKTEQIATRLQDAGYKAAAYHAGLTTPTRSQVLQDFMDEEIDIVVATIAFGMGIDKSNVRFVVHWDLPKNIENYYQETGRAGRDGLPSKTLLLFSLGDVVQLKSFIAQSHNPALTPALNDHYRKLQEAKLERLLEFCQTNYCRRRVLLNYFGESMEADCGQCDVCDNPRIKFDGTELVQKVLSAVARTNQGFGMHHIVDILVGSQNQKVTQNGHDRLPTFGVGKDETREDWLMFIKDMVNLGLLNLDYADYRKLKLTPKAVLVLKGELKVELFRPVKNQQELAKVKAEKPTRHRKKDNLNDLSEEDKVLFDKLRDLRKSLAQEQKVPPFVIFSDATLLDMTLKKPSTEEEFMQVNGVGAHKLEKYGQDFIRLIN